LRIGFETPRPAGPVIGAVRLGMVGRGFALVTTPRFFGDGLLRFKKSVSLWPFHSCRWGKFPELARYGRWLELLLNRALPEELVSLADVGFRYEPAGAVSKDVDILHADGYYIRSTCALYGAATIYRDAGAELSVPCGQTLLMTATGRARAVHVPCTLHRRPGAGPERAVIVCSFESRTIGGE
jgi:hypothetical protein